MRTEALSITRPNGPDPDPDRPASSAASRGVGRSAGLLGLVRTLIALGQALIHTLQASPAAVVLAKIVGRFGTADLKLIVARITRGLLLAANLDARLVRCAGKLDTPARPAAKPTGDRTKRHAASQLDTQSTGDAALLARLPTAQEIAASVRGKPIGVVLEEICRDLGITCEHPLWRDLQMAILANGGRLDRLFDGMQKRLHAGFARMPEVLAVAMPPPPFSQTSLAQTSTGPL